MELIEIRLIYGQYAFMFTLAINIENTFTGHLSIVGMSSVVPISERSNHVPKSEPNFSIRRFE